MPEPIRPSHLSEYTEKTLAALSAAGLGHAISVGGALGLLHYLDYRTTHDVDAWWTPAAQEEDRKRVLATVEAALRPWGEVRTRKWGEVTSLELKKDGKTIFSFQIASRTVQLQPATTLPWSDVALDSLADLVASKMIALVERGAPRDFRDIYFVCLFELMAPADCWRLWRQRQQEGGSEADLHRARIAIETHLMRISQHRPLAAIADPDQRIEAEAVRAWYTQRFLHAQLD
jgi:hypothetical protein